MNNSEILLEEFKYAADSSMQTQRDRLTIVNFYLILFTAITAAGFGIEGTSAADLDALRPVLFFSFSIISFIFIIFLIRLRQAWFGSVRVMNRIKEYFIKDNKDLEKYLLWSAKTLPNPQRFKTVSSLSALLVSVLGTISLVLGLLTLGTYAITAFLSAIMYFTLMYGIYHLMLKFDI